MRIERLILPWSAFLSLAANIEPGYAQVWTQTSAPAERWHAITSSADGKKLVAAVGGVFPGGPIYVSTNFGTDWLPTSAPTQSWYTVTCSADGATLLATATYGMPTYISRDAGDTWTAATNAPVS